MVDSHKVETPASITYPSMVSRDNIRIVLLITSLNDLDLCACDMGNVYLNTTYREKLWTIIWPNFGSEKEAMMIIEATLYELKSSGAAWRATLAETSALLGYMPTKSDRDVYLKRTPKSSGEH